MVQPQYNPQEALERVKLMMKYDTSKTLNENREIITEQDRTPEQDIALKIYNATIGAGLGTNEKELENAISLIKNPQQLKQVDDFFRKTGRNIRTNFGIDDVINDELGVGDRNTYINIEKLFKNAGITFTPGKYDYADYKGGLKINIPTSPESESDDTTSQSPYSKFKCVTKHRKAVKGKDVGGNDIYTINGVVYYGNGRKRLSNGTMANYTCNDPEFKGKSKPVEIPETLKDAEGVMRFQDWLDNNAAGWATGYKDGIIKKGENGGGYGKFGPRTQKAWNNPTYKDGYLKSLQTPTATIPDNTEGLADETEANLDQSFS
jgi:hypothetical protein